MLGLGTRPEAIKLAPVHRALRDRGDLEPIVLGTGQHREQLEQALGVFGIGVDHDLRAMTDRQRLADLAARILPDAADWLREAGADYVLVQGDTISSFLLAWVAFLEGVPVGHVEAGLRSHDLGQPFPEEANRRLTAVVADLHLAPTRGARDNLVAEGVPGERIVVTGQTGVDAVLFAARAGAPPPGLRPGPYVTVTLHRRENWPVLGELAAAIRAAADAQPDRTFVFPVHLNPIVREAVRPSLGDAPNVVLTDPLDYGTMVPLLAASELIVTDSGGLQEEGTTLGVPVIVVRNVTERPEGIAFGALDLAGTEPDRLRVAILEALAANRPVRPPAPEANPYGDGRAGRRVAAGVAWRLGLGERPEDWVPPTGGAGPNRSSASVDSVAERE